MYYLRPLALLLRRPLDLVGLEDPPVQVHKLEQGRTVICGQGARLRGLCRSMAGYIILVACSSLVPRRQLEPHLGKREIHPDEPLPPPRGPRRRAAMAEVAAPVGATAAEGGVVGLCAGRDHRQPCARAGTHY